MARYDRSYDYGLRGYRETTYRGGGQGWDTGRGAPPRPRGYGQDFGYSRAPGRYFNRVTASYNRDYTYDQPYRGNARNLNPYGGDRIDRIGDLQSYYHPYMTQGGTRTWRGGYQPPMEVPRDPLQDGRGYDRDYGWGW
ncbi:MAG: hypothetical protein JO040_06380 [Gemmatimonadetes bacterium]|nr:hypothetical protein [Gemmatimonadota bacterium]